MRNYLVSLILLALLAGCGGSQQDNQSGTQQSAQQKSLMRSQKVQASDYQDVVEGLYIAYFGRPADPVGMSNFENALLNANAPTDITQLSTAAANNPAIEALVAGFGNSAESVKLYGSDSGGSGSTDVTGFVKAVFQNVVNRAPQPAGLIFWGDAISGGRLGKGDAALAIMSAALSNNTQQGLLDAQLIANRITVAGYFTGQLTQQSKSSAYVGSAAAEDGRALLGAVTATTDVTGYENSVQTYVASMNTPSSNVLSYSLQQVVASGSSDGPVTGSFSYDWNNARVSAFIFTTPLGNFNSTVAGNMVTLANGNGYTSLIFVNGSLTLTLNYAGTPGTADIGFFNGALCTTNNVCTYKGASLPVSNLTSSAWTSDQIWVPNLVWQADMVWVPDVVWVSNWVWVSDSECSGYDDDGNCTGYEDDGYSEDDGGYVDQGSYVDEGSFVDEGAYVDEGGYPNDNLISGLTILKP